jgi:hypothetical protein
MFRSKMSQFINEAIRGKGNLEHVEILGGDMVKCRFLPDLDQLFEGIDLLVIFDLDWENAAVAGFIAEHKAIELQ